MVIFDSAGRRLAAAGLALQRRRLCTVGRLPIIAAVMLAVVAVLLQARVANAATIPVTTLTDGAPGSLRSAIIAANAASPASTTTITFSVDGTIVLTGALPAISNTVTIDGSGHAITVSGNSLYQVLSVSAGKRVDLQSITIANGNAANAGGGVYVGPGASLNANNCVITGNSTNTTGGGIATGNNATVTVTNCLVKGNSGLGVGGGGIYVASSASLNVKRSTFLGNTAAYYGGGIDADVGARLTMDSNTFLNNTANNSGGGIYVGGSASLTVTNSTFVGNSASTYGGGIENYGGKLTVINSTLSGNSAGIYGGGIDTYNTYLVITNTIIAGSPNGGDCVSSGTPVTGSHNLIKDDTYACGLSGATNVIGVDPNLGTLGLNGGATPTMLPQPGSPAIGGGDDAACPAVDQRGYARRRGRACDIGAVESGNIIVNTLAHSNDGACNAADCALWEAINVANGDPGASAIHFSVTGTLVLTSALPIINNTVSIDGRDTGGITISGNSLYQVLSVSAGNSLDLQSITIANGYAANAGGGVYVGPGARLNANNCVITGNRADTHGGGIATGNNATATVTNCLIKDNSGYGNGGGINVDGSASLTVKSNTFLGNSAAYGGGIYAGTGVTLTVDSSTFLSNTANSGGGAFLLTGATATMTNSTYLSNTAVSYGGGIENNGGKLTVINSTLSGNSAGTAGGGGIDTYNISLTLINTIIAGSPTGGDCTWTGTAVTGSHNLIKDATNACGLSNVANLIGVDPNLGPLGLNGGATPTMLPLSGSRAIGGGDDAACPAVDQRGYARQRGRACDIGAVESSDIAVNKLAHSNDGACTAAHCTLWEAINTANGDPGSSTIRFSITGTIVLTGALPAISNTVTIDGGAPRAITVSGNNLYPVMHVSPGYLLSLQSITIAKGRAANGGGAYNEGTLIVTGSVFISNTATTGNGGGVYNAGMLLATNSTFVSNTATAGNGGGVANAGTLIASNSTFVSNTASVGSGGGIDNAGLLSAINNTLVGNRAASGGGINSAGTLFLYNNIVAGSAAGGDCQGFAVVESTNLFQSSGPNACDASSLHTANLFSTDPLLHPLADNGGGMPTLAPRSGSPAINAGDNTQCLAYDQRGAKRPLGGSCDIGALEFLPPVAFLPIAQR